MGLAKGQGSLSLQFSYIVLRKELSTGGTLQNP